MAQETPTWLDLSFMEKILRKSEGDNSIQVIDISLKPATSKGDNYSSDLIRIIVEYTHVKGGRKTTEKKGMIVKLVPMAEGLRKDLILESRIFDIEIMMMTDTLEKMNKVLGSKHRFNAKAIYVQKEDPIFLLMEDLAPLGYRMACRLSGLDMDHCLMAMHALARFHAASVAVCEKEPNQKNIYAVGIFDAQYSQRIKDFFILGTKCLAAEAEKWPELGKKYSDKIAKLADHIFAMGVEVCKRNENGFNVLNHGDFWVNNMLFKYDDNGKPIDHIFVDFQQSTYTSPAIDLHYFLSTSPVQDIFENSKDVLLSEYCNILSKTMKQLECKTQPPTMEQVKDEMKKRINYEMISSFTILPIMFSNKNEAQDLDEIMKEDGSYENPGYKTDIYRKAITKRILLYDEMGLLDL